MRWSDSFNSGSYSCPRYCSDHIHHALWCNNYQNQEENILYGSSTTTACMSPCTRLFCVENSRSPKYCHTWIRWIQTPSVWYQRHQTFLWWPSWHALSTDHWGIARHQTCLSNEVSVVVEIWMKSKVPIIMLLRMIFENGGFVSRSTWIISSSWWLWTWHDIRKYNWLIASCRIHLCLVNPVGGEVMVNWGI